MLTFKNLDANFYLDIRQNLFQVPQQSVGNFKITMEFYITYKERNENYCHKDRKTRSWDVVVIVFEKKVCKQGENGMKIESNSGKGQAVMERLRNIHIAHCIQMFHICNHNRYRYK